jgi:type II secretory pathway component PulC
VRTRFSIFPVALAVLAALAVLVAANALRWRRAMAVSDAPAPAAAATEDAGPVALPEHERWTVFRAGAEKEEAPVQAGGPSDRYRLAGVFVPIGGSPSAPKALGATAIVDDKSTGGQLLAGEGDKLGDWQIVAVRSECVVLRGPGGREARLLVAASSLAGADGGTATEPAAAEPAPTILETNRFGNRIATNRWEFSRAAIMDYYNELMDDPARVSELFVAMTPDRAADGKIAGFKLNDGGERAFYEAVGLKNGDIVRQVNSFNMTSRKRAEYFIGEVVQGRMGTIVLDIEREGRPEKLVYFIR